jgi:hypothetical protein
LTSQLDAPPSAGAATLHIVPAVHFNRRYPIEDGVTASGHGWAAVRCEFAPGVESKSPHKSIKNILHRHRLTDMLSHE